MAISIMRGGRGRLFLALLPFIGIVLLFGTVVLPKAEAGSSSSSSTVASSSDDETHKVTVRFYGEAKCPYCRKFMTETWKPRVWDDDELRPHIDFDFFMFGNAYYPTKSCGAGGVGPTSTYDIKERQCWDKLCLNSTSSTTTTEKKTVVHDDDDDCFEGTPIYQHGSKEGEMNKYVSCVKDVLGLDKAVSFTVCAEGPYMDDDSLSARDVTEKCLLSSSFTKKKKSVNDASSVQRCFDERGEDLERQNAMKTPNHAGVPWVIVDGVAIDNAADIKKEICNRLLLTATRKGASSSLHSQLPKSCDTALLSLEEMMTDVESE